MAKPIFWKINWNIILDLLLRNVLLLSHLFPIHTFPSPEKQQKVFWCFQQVEKGCIGKRWVKKLQLCYVIEGDINSFNLTLPGTYPRIPKTFNIEQNFYKLLQNFRALYKFTLNYDKILHCYFLGNLAIFLEYLKTNESRYIALSVVSGSIRKLFLNDYVHICLFSIFFQ